MKIAYFDCPSGISGDMTLGALVDAGVPLAGLQAGLDSLGIVGLKLTSAEVSRKGYRACKVTVEHEPEHKHRHLHHITEMIEKSQLTAVQKELAGRIFQRIGDAEAKVHGIPIRKVHFHEVGAVDSIADIVASAIGLNLLGVDRIVGSPIPTGTGYIEIAHGRTSVPAPATAEILRGIPLAPSQVEGELTTPTGAAILASICDSFGPLPAMTIETIGYGAGSNDWKSQANIVRLMVGTTSESSLQSDEVWVLETNIDDAPGELLGHVTGLLGEAGALDVYTTAVQMKKNRPGVVVTVLCQPDKLNKLEKILFKELGTLGVRRWLCARHKLDRRQHTVETQWGPIEGKLASLPEGGVSFSPEFEACKAIAAEKGLTLREVHETALKAFKPAAG
jgi:pyridinium-3,5-bisthiocarboxylic acid mononucleotide nickel chelatase